jgi:Mycoplasma protein of unknown function, DUF285
MGYMFFDASEFNGAVYQWDVSNVLNMRGMFYDAHAFNKPICNWDVSTVRDMEGMFQNAKTFNQPLGSWNVSKVINLSHMFRGTLAFNQSLEKWDVFSVQDVCHMFFQTLAFTHFDSFRSWMVHSSCEDFNFSDGKTFRHIQNQIIDRHTLFGVIQDLNLNHIKPRSALSFEDEPPKASIACAERKRAERISRWFPISRSRT